MSSLQFLPDPWPVIVISQDNRKGYAVAIDHDGAWNNRLWLVVMCDDGSFWEVPNPEIRMRSNWTMGVVRKLWPFK